MMTRPKKHFPVFHMRYYLPERLILAAEEEAWADDLKAMRQPALFAVIRDSIEEAYELWERGIFEDMQAGNERLKFYSFIQGASMAADMLARQWKWVQPGQAEGNDIAMMERVIKKIIERQQEGTEDKKAWQNVRNFFQDMFDEQEEKTIIWFIKHTRHLRKSHGSYANMEEWILSELSVRQARSEEYNQAGTAFDDINQGPPGRDCE